MKDRSTALLLLLLLLFYALAVPQAEAAMCRDLDGHEICILKIKRSAKYHWQYRAVVSVDGQETPIEIYNCRDRTIKRKNKFPIPFKAGSPGELICSLFAK